MALLSCPDCGSQVSDYAPACPKCGRPVQTILAALRAQPPRTPAETRKSAGFRIAAVGAMLFAMAVLGIIGSLLFNQPHGPRGVDSSSDAPTPARPAVSVPQPVAIPYEEIWRGREQPGGLNRHYLVSKGASKEDVLRLASDLKAQAEPGKYVSIEIWDSAESHRRRLDESYAASEVFRHHLVSVTVNPTTGFNETQWTAEGR